MNNNSQKSMDNIHIENRILLNRETVEHKKMDIIQVVANENIKLFNFMITTNYLLDNPKDNQFIDFISQRPQSHHKKVSNDEFEKLKNDKINYNISLVIETLDKKINNEIPIQNIENILSISKQILNLIDKKIDEENKKSINTTIIENFVNKNKLHKKLIQTHKNKIATKNTTEKRKPL